jgi:23S rRNA (uracil1939-C5)-methyltransferase
VRRNVIVLQDRASRTNVPGAGCARVSQIRGRVGCAELIELRVASPNRIAPPCRYHGLGAGACGGCPWQFVTYAEQLIRKQQRVENSLQRIGVAAPIRAIEPSPLQWGYRNRAQLKTDGVRLGFVARGSNSLVAVEHCPVLSAPNNETLAKLLAQLPCRAWHPSRKHHWTTLDIDETTAPGV